MLDYKYIKQNTQEVIDNLKQRGFELDINLISEIDVKRASLQKELEALQSARNKSSKEIGILKSQGKDVTETLKQVSDFGDRIKELKDNLEIIKTEFLNYLLTIPNLLDKTVPYGKTEDDNKLIRTWGEIPKFDFQVKDHVELGEIGQGIDFKSAAKLSGSRFVVLRNRVAKLHRALAQFMLDLHCNEHGYEEVSVPLLVNLEMLEGTGQLPKFKEDQFYTNLNNQEYGLIPTAEVPLTNLVRDSILSSKDLPLKFASHSSCFRSEAGSYGKDTKGMIRLHQFEKVELVHICRKEDSFDELEKLIKNAEKVLQLLKLPYKVIALCSGDIGFGAAKTYDIEVWVPSQNKYREISSCSNCGDFQARRMLARYKDLSDSKDTQLLHTLNGSGLAVGRALVAVLENYQNSDGSINVPEILQPYMNGKTVI
tara:strand:+ start:1042 stop:2319 length:1278 start_codon:yes stop_codon:yes gene_type:complete